jgi:hypothetical protein
MGHLAPAAQAGFRSLAFSAILEEGRALFLRAAVCGLSVTRASPRRRTALGQWDRPWLGLSVIDPEYAIGTKADAQAALAIDVDRAMPPRNRSVAHTTVSLMGA